MFLLKNLKHKYFCIRKHEIKMLIITSAQVMNSVKIEIRISKNAKLPAYQPSWM